MRIQSMTTMRWLRCSALLMVLALTAVGCGSSDPTDPTGESGSEVGLGRPCTPTGLFDDGRGEVVDRTWSQSRTRALAERMTPLDLDELNRAGGRPACAFATS
jgi:hypothetical protein